MIKEKIKEILNKAGLEYYSLCKNEKYNKEYISLHFKTAVFVEGNFEKNLEESLTDVIRLVEDYKRKMKE